MKLFLATKNAGKVREMKGILAQADWGEQVEVVSALDYPEIEEPEETGETFKDNARLKADYYARMTGLFALADDSGLVVDALEGRPGVQSARYGRDDGERIGRLIQEMDSVRDDDARTAHFACAMAVASPDGSIMAESEGRLDGVIAREPRGSHGFGYDPIFDVPELGCRLAEAAPDVKNGISHRGRALQAILTQLEAILQQEPGI